MERLDKFLVRTKRFPSREKAHDAILQKTITVNGVICEKPSKEVDETSVIHVIDIFNKYVSRGGLKLEKAIVDFKLNFSGATVLDIGSSTGGFTDCALQHGASKVVAVDVGSNQLYPDLLQNPLVVSLENKDFRELTPADVNNEKFDFIVSDVSFISLTHLFPHFSTFLKQNGQLVLLIKPQFEAGHSFLNKNGIVTDEKGYKIAIQKIKQEAILYHFYINGLSISTLYEKNKNIEFLALLSFQDSGFDINYPVLFDEIKMLKKKIKNK